MIAQRDALLQPVSAACARGALLLLALIQRNSAPLCRELALPALAETSTPGVRTPRSIS